MFPATMHIVKPRPSIEYKTVLSKIDFMLKAEKKLREKIPTTSITTTST
jgi:hypothetical protein